MSLPFETDIANYDANKIPALLRNRRSNYTQSDLALPMGLSNSGYMTGFTVTPAFSLGWGSDVTKKPHSDMKNLPFYTISGWYGWATNEIN